MFKKCVLLCGVTACMLVFIYLPLVPGLCVENAQTGELLRVFRFNHEASFYVEFLHSVNRTPVREYYGIVDDEIVLIRAEYSSFGAGMPEVAEQSGSKLTVKDGLLQLDHIDQVMPEFIYRVGTIANHALFINQQKIYFSAIAPPQTGLRFTYRPVTGYQLLRRLDHGER